MTILLLFLTGLFAGTIDAIAGGGGLISLPVLLSVGIPPHVAFGTNKLQGVIGTFVATLKYYRHGYIKLNKAYLGIIIGILGGIAGSVAAQMISSEVLRKLIPILLVIIFIYTLCSPRMGQHDQEPKLRESWFYGIFGFSLAFYDGFLGPGTGSFWVFALTFLLGYNLIKATAYTKLFNLNSSFIATICFAIGGNIDYRLGLMMAAGQLIGGRLGAHLAIAKGARLIRPIFLGVVSLTIATLLYKSYVTSEMWSHLLKITPYHFLYAISTVIISVMLMRYRKKIGDK
jgi:uncharacterized membrane protein YfcA